MYKENVVMYTMEYYSPIKKNEILFFAARWMEPEAIMLTEISQTQERSMHVLPQLWKLQKLDLDVE
jgi:hypothetical protein